MKQSSALNRVLAMASGNTFASALISVFVAVYLLENGFSLAQVIMFLMIHHGSLLFGAFASVWVSNRIGLVKTFAVRILFLVTYLVLLFRLPLYPELLFVVAIFSGLESAFFWIPHNIFFIRKQIRHQQDRQ